MLLGLAIRFLSACIPFATGAVLLSGSAARVGEKVITIRDINYFAAIHRLKEKKWADPFIPLAVEDLKRYTKRALLEEMCFSEIKSLEFQGPKRNEAVDLISSQQKKNRKQWSEFLRFYVRRDDQAVEILFRSLTVDKFLEKKMETLTPLITEDEITQYLSQNSANHQESDKATLRQSVARLLRQERMQKGLENWLASLQNKYSAVTLLPQHE